MGIMSFLRERAGWLIIGFIGISIVAFLFSDASRTGGQIFGDQGNTIGVVNGEKITYDDFNSRLQTQVDQTKAQYGNAPLPAQMMGYINETTWTQMVNQMVIGKQVEDAKLEIGPLELTDLIVGANPDPRVRQAFTDPKTGVFDPNSVRSFIKNPNMDKATKDRFKAFEDDIRNTRTLTKYMNLVQGGVYATSIDLQESYDVPVKRSASYVMMDYAKLPDSKVSLTDDDLSTYYKNNLYKYQSRENSVNLDYVIIHANPSAQDSAEAKSDIQKIIADFKDSKNDSLFVSINSDSKTPVRFFKKAQLAPKLDSSFESAPAGTIVGPYFENGSFKAAKLISIKEMPDSVKSRHILLAPQGAETLPVLQKRADSIKALLDKGGSWADLAGKYSADKGSAVKGGELGYVAMGSFVKPFEDFVFNGKKGETKIVVSQFGVHIVQIEDQKNISKAFEVAQIDRTFAPSSKTVQNTYSKATSFLGSLDPKNPQTLNLEARKQGLNVRSAADLKGNDQTIPGVDQARKVVQWAFGKKAGDISEVFDLGNDFVVARLVLSKQKGNTPLEQIRRVVEADALKQKKGEMLSAQLNETGKGLSIDALAQKLALTVQKADSLSFTATSIGQNIQEPKLVGAIFGADLNKAGKPVIGDRGVYSFIATSEFGQKNQAVTQTSRDRIRSLIKGQATNTAIEALKDKANIQDNRSKFL